MSDTSKTAAPRREWRKPELRKLGTIADVAAQNNAISVQNPAKS